MDRTWDSDSQNAGSIPAGRILYKKISRRGYEGFLR